MVTKKQHYVPELLLQRFAIRSGDEKRINVYDLSRCQYRSNQNTKNVCSGNYTYDRDNSFENFLDRYIETPAGAELEKLSNSLGKISSTPSTVLLQFLLVQLARTRRAYQGNMEFVNSMMRTVFTEAANLNGWDSKIASQLSIEPKEPRAVLAYLAAYAATQYRQLSDLAVCLVVNQTNEEFILSDHPVYQHNWYLRDSSDLLANSITVRGVQFFVPISPSMTCCLYDPLVYVYRSHSRNEVVAATLDDVRIMNSFQALNAESLLMAKSESMSSILQDLGRKYADKHALTASAMNTPARQVDDGTLRSTHIARRHQTRVPAMPSFIRIRNRVRRRAVECSHRRPDVVLAHELVDKERKRRENVR